MSGASKPSSHIVESKDDLIGFIESGCKPRDQWRIGTEHEKFAYCLESLQSLPYEGARGVKALLEGLTRFDWEPVMEGDNIIALSKPDSSSISLEPAGQIELSGAPLKTIHATCGEVTSHLKQCKTVASEMGVSFVGLGYDPKWRADDKPWMPKGRYKIMREYMPKVGSLGLDMMKNTCTVQVNLDFDSEATMVEMFRVSLALQPVATALWANSPFRFGKPNGFLSFRSHIWEDVDNDRCGTLPFVFEDTFSFERYVDYILDVPMYFVYRNGEYLDASGKSFKDFLEGKLDILPGEKPTMSDWSDHMTTAFPEVRMKKFLEMRGADGGAWARICALPAFWVGLLYDGEARRGAYELIKDWTADDHAYLRREVPKTALKTGFKGRTVNEIASDALALAKTGLKNRGRLDSVGLDESHFLQALHHIVETGMTPAEEMLLAYEKRWNGSVDPVFTEYAY